MRIYGQGVGCQSCGADRELIPEGGYPIPELCAECREELPARPETDPLERLGVRLRADGEVVIVDFEPYLREAESQAQRHLEARRGWSTDTDAWAGIVHFVNEAVGCAEAESKARIVRRVPLSSV